MSSTIKSLSFSKVVVSLLILVFGLMTLVEGGQTLLRTPLAEMPAQKIVPFVLIFNAASGFVYLALFWGVFRDKAWAKPLSLGLVISIALVFLAFGIHVSQGGEFMTRTPYAMTIRLTFWILVTAWIWKRKG